MSGGRVNLINILPPPSLHYVYDCGNRNGLDWSHPSGRKSSTGMAPSILRQLGELLHKAADIIPGKYVGGIQEILTFTSSSLTSTTTIIIAIIVSSDRSSHSDDVLSNY